MAQSNKTHEQRIARLEELVLKNGINPTLARNIVGMSDDEVREVLGLHADVDLTDRVIMTGLVNQVGKATRGAETANERVTQLERRFEEFLSSDEARSAQSMVRQGMSLRAALMAHGLTEDEIRIMLRLRDEQGMTDGDFVMALVTRTSINEECIQDLHQRVEQVEQVVEDIDTGGYIPLLGWLSALVIGIVVWFVFWLNPYGATGPLTSNGKTIGSASMGWHAGGLGVGMGIMAAVLVLLIARRSGRHRRTITSTEETSSSSSSSDSSSTAVQQAVTVQRTRVRDNEDDTQAPQPAAASSSS